MMVPTLNAAVATGERVHFQGSFASHGFVVSRPSLSQSRLPSSNVVGLLPLKGRILDGWIADEVILVKVERLRNGDYMASDDQIAMYGSGEDAVQAVTDYITSLIEYYRVVASRAAVDPHTRDLLRFIRKYIRPEGDDDLAV